MSDTVAGWLAAIVVIVLAALIGVGIAALAGAFDQQHKGEHCVQKTLTHHAKTSDTWDCTKWEKNQ